jgi:small subunit ribosomal protein S11
VRLQLRPTANNLFLTVVSRRGRTLHWTSCGRRGFRGPRRSTPLAAEQTGRALARRLRRGRLSWAVVELRGLLGSRSRAALRGLVAGGRLALAALALRSPLAHNGPRPPARRRV